MPTTVIDGHTVGYATRGDAGPPVLLLHGTVMSRTAFDAVCAAMPSEAQYRYVALDLPGSGDTTLPDVPLSVEAMAMQADALMRELGHERYHVAGFSLGAVVGAALAGLKPSGVHSLTLIAGWIATDARMNATFDLWRRLIDSDPKLFARYVVAGGFTAPWVDAMTPMMDGLVDLIAANVAHGYAAQVELDMRVDISSLVDKITAPTLVIGGASDQWVDVVHSHALGRAIKGSRVEVFPVSHMIISEQPAAVAASLHAHLSAN